MVTAEIVQGTDAFQNFSCGLPREQSLLPLSPFRRKSEAHEPLYKTLSAPIGVQVEVTEACNVACQHCYNYWRDAEAPHAYATLREQQLLQVLRELINHRVFAITLTGGEPMLFKKATLNGIAMCQEYDTPCSLNSNLTTVIKEDAVKLREAGVAFVLTSLISYREDVHDAITHVPGSYKKTLRGIQAILEAGVPLGVNMVITKSNADQIYDTGKFVASLGVKSFYATKASPSLGQQNFADLAVSRETVKQSLEALVRLRDEFGMNVDILRCYPLCLIEDVTRYHKFVKRNCAAGVTTATIGADGSIRPCSHADETYGNILNEGLQPGWQRMYHWRDGSLIPKECHACSYLRACTAGCRMEAKYFGDIAGKDPMASSPDNVVASISKPREPSVVSDGFLNHRLRIHPRLRHRGEEFGGVLAAPDHPPVLVNTDTMTLMHALKEREDFSSNETAEYLGISAREVGAFLKQLVDRGVMQLVLSN